MKERTGDLWDVEDAWAYVITTNGTLKKDGSLVMGKGVARQARDMFPGIDKVLGKEIKAKGNVPLVFRAKFPEAPDVYIYVITLPTKHNWWEDSDIKLIRESVERLPEIADKFGFRTIAMTRPGCGNGNKDWETEVKPILGKYLDDRFVVVDKGEA